MASVDLVDETYIAASNESVAAVVADPAMWRTWFPDLQLTVFMDRGLQGIRWSVHGPYVGSMEIWLEKFNDGVIVHYYLRVDPSVDGSTPAPTPQTRRGYRKADKLRVAAATRWKRDVWNLKDSLE